MTDVRYESLNGSLTVELRQPAGLLARVGGAVTAAADYLYLWQERASQRTQLASLDGRILKDMGISRADAAHEAAKPFWRT